MNRFTKTILAALGIAASAGIASVLCLGLWSRIALLWRQEPEAAKTTIVCGIPPIFEDRVAPSTTPAPKKPLQEGYRRIKCDKCGQEYDVPDYESFYPYEEEMKHYHFTPEEKAAIKSLKNGRWR